jgi:DHA1 family inner membrane transport protein
VARGDWLGARAMLMSQLSARRGQLLDAREQSLRLLPLVSVTVLGASYVFNAMDRQAFPALLGQIDREYSLTLAQGGLLSTIFAINIAIFGACSAWFMQRFGRRATIVGGMLSYSLFTCLTPLATSYGQLVTYRALTGAGEALHICALFTCVGAYYGARRGAAIGAINACFGIGAFLGPVLASLLMAQIGSWRAPFYVFGTAGAGLALIVWRIVPSAFSEALDTEGAIGGPPGGPRRLWSRKLILSAVSFALVGLGFFAFVALYATYLRTQLGYSVARASMVFGLYGIGSLGGFVGGWLGDRWRERGLRLATFALCVVGFFLFHGPSSYGAQAALSACFGLLVSGYLYPRFVCVLQRSVPPHRINAATPIAMVSFYAPGLFAGYLFGKLTEVLGWSVASSLIIVAPGGLAWALMLCNRGGGSRTV